MTSKLTVQGFSLAEFLIALLIIGELAAFTIPKIIFASQQQQKMAVFKETLGALSASVYQFCLSPDSISNPNPYTYTITAINTVKQCLTNSTTQGCIGSSTSSEATEPGFTLHNGASLAGFRNSAQSREAIVIDWNGSVGPNIIGDDQMTVAINYTQATPYNGANKCSIASFSSDTASVTLYQSIHTN